MSFRVRINPYSHLESLAFYHLQAVREKQHISGPSGIRLDCMSCLIALAFSVEALLNLVGSRRVPDWKERAAFMTKMKTLQARLGFEFDEKLEPYTTISRLKRARDRMAHGQPAEFVLKSEDTNVLAQAMQSPWADSTTPEFAMHAYEEVQRFKIMLLKRARIKPGSTYTTAIGGAQ
jgi:hypothetical protein